MSVPSRFSGEDPRRLVVDQTDWFAAEPESEGLAHYLAVLRSKVWLIVLTVGMCVAAALLYVAQSEKVFEADADLLVTPLPRDSSLIGLGLPQESADPVRDIQTIARLIETAPVARLVINRLDLSDTPRKLLKDIQTTPVGGSNVVNIAARANNPELSAAIANAFGVASVDYRTERLHDQLDVAIPILRRQIGRLRPDDPGREPLIARLRDLQALRALDDPTLRLETRAEPPEGQVSPRPALSVAAAVLVGLILGGAAALGSQLLDPRLQREEQLRRYRVPILARVPLDSKKRRGPLLPARVSPMTHDAYLLLGATLAADLAERGTKRSVLVTGPSAGDGKTTTALNLAAGVSEIERVILIEGDFRRPTLAEAYGLEPKNGVSTVMARRLPLADALVNLSSSTPRLQVLAQPAGEVSLPAVVTPASAEWLISQALTLANWAIVDAPPLALVPEAIPLATRVSDVILVVRIGNTRLKALQDLAELLVQQGVTPTGFVVIGGKSHSSSYHA